LFISVGYIYTPNLIVRGRLVVVSMRWRFLLVALVGTGAYLALLHVSYTFLGGSYYPPPQWWSDHLNLRPVAPASWFVLINAAGAVLAAIPVALGVVLFGRAHKPALGLVVGVPPSLYIMGSGLVAYGLPKHAVAWVIDVFQFLSIGLAVLLAVVLFSGVHLYSVRAPQSRR
jgi:hypothetical protein